MTRRTVADSEKPAIGGLLITEERYVKRAGK